jgi:putative oxidoreductase
MPMSPQTSQRRLSLGILLVRILVGSVFLSEGIQKFLFPASLGVGRFAKIGIPWPHYSAPFVGAVEIVFGALLILGLFTSWASILLLIDITVAIATTKYPMLLKQGIWATLHEARTDFCMFVGLCAILLMGAGRYSFDRGALRKIGE